MFADTSSYAVDLFPVKLIENIVSYFAGNVSMETMLIFSLLFLSMSSTHALRCNELLMGQYFCSAPVIDPDLQAEKDCTRNKTVSVPCKLASGIFCDEAVVDGNSTVFFKEVPCRFINEKSFGTALLLSIFLGVFGVDRFYLGYPAVGLFKFCTLGFFMIFQFIDVVLIATQVLKPADGSDYLMDYFGQRLYGVGKDNDTYYLPT